MVLLVTLAPVEPEAIVVEKAAFPATLRIFPAEKLLVVVVVLMLPKVSTTPTSRGSAVDVVPGILVTPGAAS